MIKPDEIMDKSFSKAFNGYSKAEVDDYLYLIKKEMEALIKDYDYLKLKLSEKESEIKVLKDNEGAIKDAILTAQKASDEMKKIANEEGLKVINKSKIEARNIVDEARKEADQIRKDHSVLVESLKEEYNEIKSAKENLEKDYSEFLLNYKKLLTEQLNKFDI